MFWFRIFSLILFLTTYVSAQNEKITVQFSGDTTIILNIGASENCAARFAIDVKIVGSNITMTERDTIKQKATCGCLFDMSASIIGLQAGTYRVDVYRDYLKKYSYMRDTTVLIGTIVFSKVQSGSISQLTNTFQSGCYEPSDVKSSQERFDDITISCYPNPILLPNANPSINIQYHLDQAGQTLINIFDASGKKLFTVLDEPKDAGDHELRLHTSLFRSSGIYYCTLTTVKHSSEMNESRIVKLVVMKR